MKKKLAYLSAISLMALGSTSASAELPPAATTALAGIGTGITDTETAVWPYIGASLVAVTIIKLVKRFTSKI